MIAKSLWSPFSMDRPGPISKWSSRNLGLCCKHAISFTPIKHNYSYYRYETKIRNYNAFCAIAQLQCILCKWCQFLCRIYSGSINKSRYLKQLVFPWTHIVISQRFDYILETRWNKPRKPEIHIVNFPTLLLQGPLLSAIGISDK